MYQYLQCPELLFCRLAIVKPEVVASLEVDGDGGVWVVLEVDGQHLLRHIVVVQLVVTQRHVHVEGEVLPEGAEEVLMSGMSEWLCGGVNEGLNV